MVIASLCGFAVAAQFVSLDFLEPPYYIALLGAGVLKLSTRSLPSNGPDVDIGDLEPSWALEDWGPDFVNPVDDPGLESLTRSVLRAEL
jgi:hypothetical protein